MPQGRLTNSADRKRSHLETAQAALANLQDDLDEISLRTRQAMRRTRVVEPVLLPSLDRLAQVREAVVMAQRELASFWHEQNDGAWSFTEDADD